MSKKATVVTLGCAKNSVDSEHIKGSLVKNGIALTEAPEDADYVIINTCGFIEAAKRESINAILEVVELKNCAQPKKVIITGCLAQRYHDELAEEIPEIDVLVSLAREWDIAEMINTGEFKSDRATQPSRNFLDYPERLLSGLPYAYLQIADGCDNRCSYCAIPLIRGRYKSKPLERIIMEARQLDNSQVREINLIAQDTGRYGYDLYGRKRMIDLLDSLTGLNNIKWIRLLYLQPYTIDDELINAIKRNNLIVPYLDIPFQHASHRVLRAMNRNGAGSDYLAQIAWLRRSIPEITLRTTIIVGFPGETDNDFGELIEFVKNAQLDYLGVFEYSAEEGTAAVNLGNQVPKDTIKERYHQLTALQDLISQSRSENRIGRTFDVLIEREVDSERALFEGRAWWQAPEVDGFTYVTGELKPGEIVKVTLDKFDGCDFYGRLVSGLSK
ncbi:MAG: 30S ribosomal protein S12 methylthiotransferase RimO [Actinobacteria bacterium]|nr:30S ribosomal protein S12 methylthiotransferase RimO [Actinomycetota bacterium]